MKKFYNGIKNAERGILLAHLLAIVTMLIWGATFVSTKKLLINGLTPIQIFTMRFLLAYLLMSVSILFSNGDILSKRLFANNIPDEIMMMVLGITGGSGYFYSENMALEYTSASNVSLIVCSCPLFTLLLLKAIRNDVQLPFRVVCGSILAFMGVAFLIYNDQFVWRLSLKGDGLAFIACLMWSVYTLVLRPLNERYSSLFITRKVFFYGMLTTLPHYFDANNLPDWQTLCSHAVAWRLLFLSVIASWACFAAWNHVVKKIGVIHSSNYIYLNPFGTVVLAMLILDELLTPALIVGAGLIFSGLFLSNER